MRKQIAIAWGFVLGASLCFAVMFSMPKASGLELDWTQVAFLRYFGGFVFMALALAMRGGLNRIRLTYWYIHIPRALFGVGTVGCIVYAAQQMPYADTVAVSFSKGGFVLVFSALFIGESVGWVRLSALVTSFSGAVVILAGQHGGLTWSFLSGAGGVAILGAVFMAGEVVLLKLAAMRDNVLSMLFWVNGAGMLISGLLAVPNWQPFGSGSILFILAMGPIALLGQAFNYFGHKLADASFLAPLGYATVAYSVLIGWLVFGEVLDVSSVLGIGLVLAGGIVSARTPLDTITARPICSKDLTT